jgi:hypothetical protein
VHHLSICAIYRNEARYLREWVAFHRLMGVERFFLYDNASTDEHEAVLRPFVEDGCVTVTPWPQVPGQMAAYEDCLRRRRDESRWIAFIDLDEFLFSPSGAVVADVLHDFDQHPGVVVNWAMFGTSGHRDPPPGLVTENYVRRSDATGWNRQTKSIVDPRRVSLFCGPHIFLFKDGTAVDERGRPLVRPTRTWTDEVSFARLRLNHYVTRSEREYVAKLARTAPDMGARGSLTTPQLARRLHVLNEVEDRTIQVHLPALRKALADRGGPT